MAALQQNAIILVRADPAEPPSEFGLAFWTELGVALLTAGIVAGFARRDAASAQAPPRRWLRILTAAALFAGGITLQLVIDDVWMRGFASDLPILVLLGSGGFLLIGAILFGLTDFWLGIWRPSRVRVWLVTAILVFPAVILAAIAVAFLVQGGTLTALLDPMLAPVGVFSAAAGLIWWRYLPAPGQGVEKTFE